MSSTSNGGGGGQGGKGRGERLYHHVYQAYKIIKGVSLNTDSSDNKDNEATTSTERGAQAPRGEEDPLSLCSSSHLTPEALEDIHRCLMWSFLAITDDTEPSEKKKFFKEQLEGLKMITGSEERAYLPLSTILKEQFDLQLDCVMDEKRWTPKACIDLQGYIAHNDDVIVLSYRCAATLRDWLTNLQATATVWNVDQDYYSNNNDDNTNNNNNDSSRQGEDECCCSSTEVDLEQQPQPCASSHSISSSVSSSPNNSNVDQQQVPCVHTGFYHNFLASLPMIKQHIEPLLFDVAKPRKLYVTGYSLGAALATLASIHFLEEYDWNNNSGSENNNSFCSVTAGCPRVCGQAMRSRLEELLQQQQALSLDHEPSSQSNDNDKIQMYRLVTANDVIPRLPPKHMGFCHALSDRVLIQKDDQQLVYLTKENKAKFYSKNGGFKTSNLIQLACNLVESSKSRSSKNNNKNNNPNSSSSFDQEDEESGTGGGGGLMATLIDSIIPPHMPENYLKTFLSKAIREQQQRQQQQLDDIHRSNHNNNINDFDDNKSSPSSSSAPPPPYAPPPPPYAPPYAPPPPSAPPPVAFSGYVDPNHDYVDNDYDDCLIESGAGLRKHE